eukprot:gene48231-55070_t
MDHAVGLGRNMASWGAEQAAQFGWAVEGWDAEVAVLISFVGVQAIVLIVGLRAGAAVARL